MGVCCAKSFTKREVLQINAVNWLDKKENLHDYERKTQDKHEFYSL